MDRIAEAALGFGAGVATATVALSFYVRPLRFQVEALAQSLQVWKHRHGAVLADANAAWTAMETLMVNRLGYTHQAAADAIQVWRQNGYGKPRLGGVEIGAPR